MTLGERVLTLQRRAGNAAVLRALGLSTSPALARVPAPSASSTLARVPAPSASSTLAREPDPSPAPAPWSFSPLKPGAVPGAVDLFPWQSTDPAKRWKAQDDLLWAAERPHTVYVEVTAYGLDKAKKTDVAAPPAPAGGDAPNPVSSATPDAGQGQPQVVPVAASQPPVQGVQVQVSWGLAAEAHTKPTGPGSGKDESPSTDWQSSAQVALTVAYHKEGQAGLEWSTQFQVNWSDATLLRAMSPASLQNIQIGSQLAYVIPLWKNVQAQIFAQIMFGLTPDGKPVAQLGGGGQLQWKLTDHLSLFVQGNLGGTENSGDRRDPSYTGDASMQGGAIYSW